MSVYKFKVWLIGAGASAKDAKQQACAPSSLILACYFAPVKRGVMRHFKSLSLKRFLPQVFSSNWLLGTVA
ncbi:hypothetical protein PPHE_a0994 [Pseudoalteromonas phenolica O-BC30]|nr:hypothetical protein [Pseudoalteromonas phenolica O-BC30]